MVTIADLDNDLLTDRIKPVIGMTELTNSSTYHFALTAFDTQGKTSDFSEELCVEVVAAAVAAGALSPQHLSGFVRQLCFCSPRFKPLNILHKNLIVE